ncbi:MAG: DUF1254 domain-containing protein [Phycisphaeraceae bacterium]
MNREIEKIMTELKEATLHGDEVIDSPYGTVELQHSFMTEKSSRRLFDAMDFQRACQAYLWSIPLVGMATWQKELDRNYDTGELGVFAVLVSLKEKRGLVTANLTTPYIILFYDLRKGALVIDLPAGATAGAVLDAWQRPVADLGLTGPDQGQGGIYILAGPEGDRGNLANEDAYVSQSPTNYVMVGVRILDPSPEFAKHFKDTIRMGRYGEPMGNCKFNEYLDREWSGTPSRGLGYWKTLHEAIDREPVREQDKVWMAMLEPLGIKKGKSFRPDERQTRILLEGAAMCELMTRNIQVNPRYTGPYWAGTSWYKSFDFTVPQSTDYKVELDEWATWFYEAITSSEGMVNPVVGKGQVYMTTKRDSNGDLLQADRTYKLAVPADVPVAQFWSLTLYSESTRRPYDNGGTEIQSTSLDSRMEQLQHNEDGSIDLYIGATTPEGLKGNFMRTVDQDGWFVYFRLYAPTEAFFDKSFSLPDFQRIE